LLLDNVRFLPDEQSRRSIEGHANSVIVRALAKYFDYFILDGFAVSHRYHASVVGFATVIPSVMGRLMEHEVRNLSSYLEPDKKSIVILGGAKVKDAVKYIEMLLRSGRVDKILLTGLVAFVFHIASGLRVDDKIMDRIRAEYSKSIPKIKELIETGNIELPVDYAFYQKGRIEVNVEKGDLIRDTPKDIGILTVSKYADIINDYDVVFIRGPAGVIEDDNFRIGTIELLRRVSSKRVNIVICGGHLASVLSRTPINIDNCYISTGGGAALEFIARGTLAGIEALKLSKKLFRRQQNIYFRG